MTEETKKKFGVGKGCAIVAVAIVGLGVIGAIAGGGEGGGKDASPAAQQAPAPAVEVSAAQLSQSFQENEAKAKLDFGEKSLKVSGKVKAIDLDFADNPVIRLAGSGDVQGMGVSEGGKVTDVAVNGLSKEVAAQINRGDALVVVCGKVDEVLGGPQLGDCSVAK